MTEEQQEMYLALSARVNSLSDDVDKFRNELTEVSVRAQEDGRRLANELARKYEQADRRLADEMAEAILKVHEKLDKALSLDEDRHARQEQQTANLQLSVDNLAASLLEPMETWKTAKYGAKAAAAVASFIKVVLPIVAAAAIAFSAWQTKLIADLSSTLKIESAQQNQRSTTNR